MNGLVEAIDAALAADVDALTDAELLDRVLAADRAINRLAAVKLTALREVHRRGAASASHRSTAAWLRAETRCSPAPASRQVNLANDLAEVMPAMHGALADGTVSATHAQTAARLRKFSADESVRETDADVTTAAKQMPINEFASFVMSLQHALAPDVTAADETRAFEQRELVADTTIHGIGVGRWLLDPVSHETVVAAVHAASAPAPDGWLRPGRERMADGLITIARFFLDHRSEPSSAKKAFPHLLVRVDLGTVTRRPGSPAAVTEYGGAISGQAARRIGCDAAVTRVVFGPGSEIVDVGRASRTFTAAARRAIVARDGQCRWPHCTIPASWCEAHHIVHWADGGPSDADNGVLLCGRHHDQMHHDHCAVVVRPDGSRTVDVARFSGYRRPIQDVRAQPTRGSPTARAG